MARGRPVLAGLALALLAACGAPAPPPPLPSCGVAEVDQTAAFLRHVVLEQRRAGRFPDPAALAEWITSTPGSAEIIPPNPETEPDAASRYRGPRPGRGVGIWRQPSAQKIFDHFILVSGDNAANVVVLAAYRFGEAEPFFTWRI